MNTTTTDSSRDSVPEVLRLRAATNLDASEPDREATRTREQAEDTLAPPPSRHRSRGRVSTLAAALRRLDGAVDVVPEPPADPAERRSLPRRTGRSAARIAAYSSDRTPDEWTLRRSPRCTVLDLTLRSIAFTSDLAFAAGTRLVARLARRPGDPEVLDVTGHVVRCQCRSATHDVVMAFERPLTLEQLETYGRPLLDAEFV